VFAQSEADYQGWMKMVAPTNQSLQRNVQSGLYGDTNSANLIPADAQKLQDIFKQVEDFWQKRSAADAVNFAKQAQTAAAAVLKSTQAGNMDQASVDAKSLSATCGGCHMAHREGANGAFKIK